VTIPVRIAVTVLAAVAVCSAACSSQPPKEERPKPVNPRAASLREGFGSMDRLVEAAKREGTLNVIGLPEHWVGYGELLDRFAKKYGITVVRLEPEASSARQIETAAQRKDTGNAPDVFDLSLEVAVANAGRFAPYKVTTWQDIPDDLKDPSGRWYAAYGGYMSIAYDSARMRRPGSYAALLSPGVRVALPGDPLTSASAFNGVMAASLRNGVPDPARAVDFFTRLKRDGMLGRPEQATAVIDWDFLNVARAAARGGGWRVTVPENAVLAAYYHQAINKDAPHPAAARLWQEFLFSDEAQNIFLRAHARPARMEAMEMRGTLDRGAAERLPAVSGAPVTLTIPQQDEAKAYLQRHWARAMG